MNNYLLQLLKEVNTVIIPGLGALTITSEATGEILFMPYLKFDDGTLVNHIAQAEGIEVGAAKAKVAEFVKEVTEEVENGATFEINSFGNFKKTGDEITFEQYNFAPKPISPVTEQVVEAKPEEQQTEVESVEETASEDQAAKEATQLEEQAAIAAAEQLAAEQAEKEVEANRLEQERLAEQKRAEAEEIARQESAAAEQSAKEAAAEAERLQKIADEEQLIAAREEERKAEQARLEEEQRIENDRIAAESEAKRIEDEQRALEEAEQEKAAEAAKESTTEETPLTVPEEVIAPATTVLAEDSAIEPTPPEPVIIEQKTEPIPEKEQPKPAGNAKKTGKNNASKNRPDVAPVAPTVTTERYKSDLHRKDAEPAKKKTSVFAYILWGIVVLILGGGTYVAINFNKLKQDFPVLADLSGENDEKAKGKKEIMVSEPIPAEEKETDDTTADESPDMSADQPGTAEKAETPAPPVATPAPEPVMKEKPVVVKEKPIEKPKPAPVKPVPVKPAPKPVVKPVPAPVKPVVKEKPVAKPVPVKPAPKPVVKPAPAPVKPVVKKTEPKKVTPVPAEQPKKPTIASAEKPAKKSSVSFPPPNPDKPFHVIGGSFLSLDNAQRLAVSLVEKGQPSVIIGKFNGLYRVSIVSFASETDAILAQQSLKGIAPLSWVLKWP